MPRQQLKDMKPSVIQARICDYMGEMAEIDAQPHQCRDYYRRVILEHSIKEMRRHLAQEPMRSVS